MKIKPRFLLISPNPGLYRIFLVLRNANGRTVYKILAGRAGCQRRSPVGIRSLCVTGVANDVGLDAWDVGSRIDKEKKKVTSTNDGGVSSPLRLEG